MELLNQFDVANPDHVSVITRDGKVIISIRKDGTTDKGC
jgi:formylmethanofuran dehydrogenase subunit D